MTIHGEVRVTSIGMSRRGVTAEARPILLFQIAEDVIDQLFALHDTTFLPKVYGLPERPDRYKSHRIEFARFRDMGIPAILMRIEAPTYDPHGSRFWRGHNQRHYRCQILARKLRVRDNIKPTLLETLWMDDHYTRGLMCTFPDELMQPVGHEDPLTSRQKPIPLNDQDMAVK